MKVYFVRHGEGEHNVNNLYSGPQFNLTEKGRLQAKVISSRLASLPIDVIITSSYIRTQQTTEIINQKLNKKVVVSDLPIELRRPTELVGKVISDEKSKEIRKKIDENFHLSEWHYSDEENFYDLKKRVLEFLDYLSALEYENVLVVSHIHFIRIAVLSMMLKEKLTSDIFLAGLSFLNMENSGLTVCEYLKNEWKLDTWNDISHLADQSTGFDG